MLLKQSTARNLLVFVTDEADHVTGLEGATLTITASKDGGAFSSISPTVTERGDGWYSLALTTSHTDTLGDLALHITATGADPTDLVRQVVVGLPGEDAASIAAILADTNELQTDWANGGRLDLILDARASQASVDTIDDLLDTEVAAIIAALADIDSDVANVDTDVAAVAAAVAALPTDAAIADKLLGRTLAGGADGGRTVKDALRAIRNKTELAAGVLTVYAEDDATPAWTAAVTQAARDPLTAIDPA